MPKNILRTTYMIERNIDVGIEDDVDFNNMFPEEDDIQNAFLAIQKASNLASILILQEDVNKKDWVVRSRSIL